MKASKCHPDRRWKAHGLCVNCYEASGHRLHNSVKATCHPERPHQAKGLCKPCYMAKYLAEYDRPLASKNKRRESHWEKRLGSTFTVSDFEVLEKNQNGKCALCLQTSSKTLSVDHCHEAGVIRGLLCDYCNRRLLIPRNTPELLRRAADYIEKRGNLDAHISEHPDLSITA